MATIETRQELIEAIAYAALARRKAIAEFREAASDAAPTWAWDQKRRAIDQAEDYLSKLTDTLAGEK